MTHPPVQSLKSREMRGMTSSSLNLLEKNRYSDS